MKKFELIVHDNGTHSLRDLTSGEAMHSRIGPKEEAEGLYVNQARLVERLQTPGEDLVLWDVGMGTGANVLVALDQIQGSQPARRLKIHSFESDITGIETALEYRDLFPFLKNNSEAVQGLLQNRTFQSDLFSWTLHEGDFFTNLEKASRPHVIFYDFYSPQACPELWNVECFRTIRKFLGKQTCDLYTYTSSTLVRNSMLRAGFYVGTGFGTSMKRESTIASTELDRLENPLAVDERWLEKLARSASSGKIAASELELIQAEISASRQFRPQA